MCTAAGRFWQTEKSPRPLKKKMSGRKKIVPWVKYCTVVSLKDDAWGWLADLGRGHW